MSDPDRTKEELVEEVAHLQQRVAELEALEAKRIQAEEALRESEERFRTIADFTYDWEHWLDPQGAPLYVSPSCERITGYTPAELMHDQTLFWQMVHPADQAKIKAHLKEELNNQEAMALDFKIITKQGEERWIGHVCQPVYSQGGQHLGRRASNRDITQRIRAKESLRASEETYRQMFQAHPTVKLLIDPKNGLIVDANQAAQSFYGYSSLKGMKIEQINRLSQSQVKAQMRQAQAEKRNHFFFKHRLASGEIRDVEIHSGPITVGDQTLLYSIIHDITERRQMEEALRQSEQKYKQIISATAEGFWLLDANGQIIDVNAALCDMLEYSCSDIIGRRPDQLVAGDHTEFLAQALNQTEPQTYQITLKTAQGRSVFAIANVAILPDESTNQTLTFAFITNITAYKQAQKKLKQLSSVVEQTADQVLITDKDGRIEYVNPAFEQLTGYRKEEVLGRTPRLLKSGRHSHKFYKRLWGTILAGESYRGILINRKKNGQLYFEEKTVTPLKDAAGQITHFVSTGKDITKRKQAEVALRESEANYRQLANSITDVFFAVDQQLRCTYWNTASETLTGITAMQAINKPIHQSFSALSDDDTVEILRQALKTQRPQSFVKAYRPGSKQLYFEFTVYPSKKGLSIFAKEITQRKEAEEALRQRNRELALINHITQGFISTFEVDQLLSIILEGVEHWLEITNASIWLVDSETGQLVCRQVSNPEGQRLIGWRLAPGQGLAGWVAQQGQSSIVPDAEQDERFAQEIVKQTKMKVRSILSVPLKVKSAVVGVLQVVDTKAARFTNSDLALLEPLAATAAIALENARLYEQARHDAETKAVLLQEVNHRVKNNLSAIIGLLYTAQRQGEIINDPLYQSVMKDLVNRVQGLATVHSMLSASGWSPILLSNLSTQVIHSALQILPNQKEIAVNVSNSNIRVTSDQAHNLALIINELAVNTIKHALKEQNKVEINVTISSEQKEIIKFEFRDTGPGYPHDVLSPTARRHSVGFDLIQNVIRRSLRGDLLLHNNNGAVTIIRFKANPSIFENGAGLKSYKKKLGEIDHDI